MAALHVTGDVYRSMADSNLSISWTDVDAPNITLDQIYMQSWSTESNIRIFYGSMSKISEFLTYGLIKHIDVDPAINPMEFLNIITETLMGKFDRISKCNRLRSHITSRIPIPFRNCGPGPESVFSSEYINNYYESSGLEHRVTCILPDGSWTHHQHHASHDYLHKQFQFINDKSFDIGQKKLRAMFDSFVGRYPLIYIGSAPGTAWLQSHLLDNTKVLSIDALDLKSEHHNVTHCKTFLSFLNLSETIDTMKSFIDQNGGVADFLDDLRGDYVDEDQFDQMIQNEWALKTAILESLGSRLRRVLLKINSTTSRHVKIPNTNYCLFPQPFTISRNVAELRLLFTSNHSISFIPASESLKKTITAWHQSVKTNALETEVGVYSNVSLFYNLAYTRYEFNNYIHGTPPHAKFDLALFTININRMEDRKLYFQRLVETGRRGIISFLSPKHLTPAETSINELEEIPPQLWCVVDSRAFTREYIAGLHVIVPPDYRIFRNEIATTQSFMVKFAMLPILSNITQRQYDHIKHTAAESQGLVFSRFPNTYSISDPLVSVSGHALRIAYLSLTGYDVSVLSYLSRIAYNQKSFGSSKDKKVADDHPFPVYEWFDWKNITVTDIERNSHVYWHSSLEWITGIQAGYIISEKTYDYTHSRELKPSAWGTEVLGRLMSFLTSDTRQGHEAFQWHKTTPKVLPGSRRVDLCRSLLTNLQENKNIYANLCSRKPKLSSVEKKLWSAGISFGLDRYIRALHILQAGLDVVSIADSTLLSTTILSINTFPELSIDSQGFAKITKASSVVLQYGDIVEHIIGPRVEATNLLILRFVAWWFDNPDLPTFLGSVNYINLEH